MNVENRVLDVIRTFQSDRNATTGQLPGQLPGQLGPELGLYQDGLGWDSLDAAEFSARLEQAFGTDPYSAGVFPSTVGDIVRFYETQGA